MHLSALTGLLSVLPRLYIMHSVTQDASCVTSRHSHVEPRSLREVSLSIDLRVCCLHVQRGACWTNVAVFILIYFQLLYVEAVLFHTPMRVKVRVRSPDDANYFREREKARVIIWII